MQESLTPLRDESYDYILGQKKVNTAKQIAYEIWHDVNDRRGIKWEFQRCDEDVQESIIQKWIDIVEEKLTPSTDKNK